MEIMDEVVNVLPPAWYYPVITCARINFDGSEFTTDNFRETIWNQASNIIVHGETIGTVEVFYLEEKIEMDEGPFLKEERNLINEVALRLGETCERMYRDKQVIESRENLRDLAKRLQAIREEERTMIAREIHDELGQTLTGLKMDLSWLLGRLPKSWKHLTLRAREMISLIDSTINFVRKLSTELRPSMLDDLGLRSAIEWQVQEFANRMGCKYNLCINMLDYQPDNDLDTAIFRILQESLTNIARHAKADYVEISVDEVDTQLVLSIKDNGIGIDEEKINSSSLGLVSMRERANTFGGTFSIKALEDGGSMVSLTMPYIKEVT
jgi:signal transduction histidine kinase